MKVMRTPEVTPDELAFAMAVGSAAASGKTPLSGVGGYGLTLDRGDGEVSEITFNETPMNRAMFAIKEQFPDGPFTALMMRAWALGELLDDERMADFIRTSPDDPEQEEIHQAALDIAAVMPLNPQGHFNANTFFKRAVARAQEIEG